MGFENEITLLRASVIVKAKAANETKFWIIFLCYQIHLAKIKPKSTVLE